MLKFVNKTYNNVFLILFNRLIRDIQKMQL